MQVEEQKTSTELKKEYTVKLAAKDIDTKVEMRLNVLGAAMTVPGFRKGKAPLNIVRKQHGQRAWAEAVEQAIQEAADKVINDNKLKPAGQPDVQVDSLEPGQDINFRLVVEVMPPIKLMDFSKITLTRKKVEGDKTAVQETIDNIRSSQKRLTDTAEGTKAENGDTLIIDFDGEAEEVGKLPGMKAEGARLELGSNTFIPGFEEQLVGVKAGDKIDVKVTFPEQYHAAELAGKQATFAVTVQSVQKTALPDMDDEFAQGLGLPDMQTLIAHIERDVQEELDRLARLALKRDLLDVLDENHVFDAPQSMIDAEFAAIEKQATDAAEEEKDELRAIAERRVRLGLVLNEVGETNGVTVTPEELRAGAIAEARKYPGQEAKIFEMFQKNPQTLARLRAPIFEEKVIDLIVSKAKVTDASVTREDLIKSLEEAETYQKPAAEKKTKKAAKA